VAVVNNFFSIDMGHYLNCVSVCLCACAQTFCVERHVLVFVRPSRCNEQNMWNPTTTNGERKNVEPNHDKNVEPNHDKDCE